MRSLPVLLLVLAGTATACLTAAPPPWYRELEVIGIRFITAPEIKGMMDRGEPFVLVDARDEAHYRNGHITWASATSS